jgi:GR25 family glycosyltransferase involved in LPS biosynthesis
MMRFFLPLILAASLDAALEDHFKKITDKSGSYQIKNIDFIYTINLDQRPEKFQRCLEQLTPYQIVPYRFSAVNGWELSLQTINDVGVRYQFWMKSGHWGTRYLPDGDGQPHHEIVEVPKDTYFCHCMSRGAIGIVLSHLSVLQDAYDSGYETIWVMEDDIEIIQNPLMLSALIEQLDGLVGKEGWDVLFTDRDTRNNLGQYVPNTAYAWRPNFEPPDPKKSEYREDISPDFRRIGARFGAYSMIVRRSGMKKILSFYKNFNIFLPYDIDFVLPFGMRFFTVTHDVVSTQLGAPSDNGGPNYKKQQESNTNVRSSL